MKMDKPSPVGVAVDEVQPLSPPLSTNEGDDSRAENIAVISSTRSNGSKSTDRDTDQQESNTVKINGDGDGEGEIDEENLLNYIAELANDNPNNGATTSENQRLPTEEELLGQEPPTPVSKIDEERVLLGSKDIFESPVSQHSRTATSDGENNGASTLSTPQRDRCPLVERSPAHLQKSPLVQAGTPSVAQLQNIEILSTPEGNECEVSSGEEPGSNGVDADPPGATEEALAEPNELVKNLDDAPDSTTDTLEPSTSTHDGNARPKSVESVEANAVGDDNEAAPPKEGQPMDVDKPGAADDQTTDGNVKAVESEREELLTKFLTYCQRFRSSSESSSASVVRQRFRVTDLLKWFLEDEGRPGPLTFRKRLERTGFSVPSSVSLPPSQVVDLLVENPAETSLKELCTKGVSGKSDDIPDTTSQRQHFSRFPAPNMTRFLFDIGYNLVSETAYRSVLNKAVSELSSSGSASSNEASAVERQAQIVEHIRRVYEDAKKQNQPFKLRLYHCPIEYCDFVTETQLQLYEHRRKPHKKTHRWECALCMKFSSWNDEDMEEHYNFEHGFTSSAKWDLPSSRAPCPLCDQDFPFKGQMKLHLRECPMNVRHVKITGSPETEADVLNLHLWPRVEERRTSAAPNANQQRKVPIRPKDGSAPFSIKSVPSGRVADVVSLVAAGHGQLRAPPKAGSTLPGLPRVYPSVLRSTQTVQQQQQQQRLIQQQQQQQQQLVRQIYMTQQQQMQRARTSTTATVPGIQTPTIQRAPQRGVMERFECEICDATHWKKLEYLKHLQLEHRKLLDKTESDLAGAAPLACSRCRDRFYSYEGLERHLLMEHNLVTNELLSKAQKRQDTGKCRICTRIYAFNLLQHLVQDHQRTLCSAEIVYSCDVCHFQCNSYIQLELHLRNHHRDNNAAAALKNTASNAPQTAAHTQSSNTLSVITPRQQQSMVVVQQPPRLGQQYATRHQQPQTAAAILQAALNNHKRPLPSTFSTGRSSDQSDRPPKLMRIADAGTNRTTGLPGTNSRMQQLQRLEPRPSAGHSQQQQAANQRKQLRYCCTPCDLKFISYEAVLKHWVERHLKPLRVPLCRIDKCDQCQEKLTGKRKRDSNEEDSAAQAPAEGEGTSVQQEQTGGNGLILDLELPEYVEPECTVVDDIEVLPPQPQEIICLD